MLKFSCPKCSKKYKAPETSAGKDIKCPCGNTVKIPAPAKEPAVPPKKDATEIFPQKDVIPAGPQEDAIAMREEPAAAKPEAPSRPAGALNEVGKDGEWKPMWDKERFDSQAEERTPILSAKGVIFLILAVIILPALGLYANYAYKGYLANAAFRNGMKALKDDSNEEALERFRECIEMRPEWSAAYLPAAFLAYESNDLEEAGYFLEKLAGMDNVSYPSLVHNNLAAVAMAQEKPDYDEVRSHFEKAIEEDSGCAPAKLGLALLSYDKNKLEAAKKYLEGLTDSSDSGTGTYSRMQMRIAFAEGDKEKFLSTYKITSTKGQDTMFEREAALMGLELLLAQPDFDELKDIPLLHLARKVNTPEREGDDYILVQTVIAGLLSRIGMHSESAVELEKIVKPEDSASDFTHMLARASAAASRGTLHEEKKAEQEEKAFVLYKKLIDNKEFLEKKGGSLILEAADLCNKTGRREDAWIFLKKGMSSFSSNAGLYRMAGVLCFQDSKFEEGIDYFEKSLKLDPNQEKLRDEVKSYRVEPAFVDFRPSKPEDLVTRPKIHIEVKSGTRFQIKPGSVKLVLDGTPRKLVMSGNEGSFVPESDLGGGKHVAEFFAEDVVGNSGSKSFTFWIDLSGPVSKLVRPGAVTKETKPTIEIKLEDELSSIATESVTIVLKSAPGSPHDVTIPIVSRGQYNLTDKTHGIERGNPVSKDGKIAFRVPGRLKPGTYLITIKMSDVHDNSSKQELKFTIEGEAEDTE